MEQPKYSLIVPAYKTEAYIRQCIDSILVQTYGRFEVILVDDGSPDGCGAICDDYAAQDERIRVIHKENGGVGGARKAAANICAGDYIVCVDSDDYIADDLLERLTEIIRAHEPDVICYDAWQYFNEEDIRDLRGSVPTGFYREDGLKTIHDSLILDRDHRPAILFGVCGKAVRREWYVRFQMPVPNDISIGEDLAVTAPLLAQCESVYISDFHGYYYRCNPTSAMNTFKKDESGQILRVADYLDTAMDAQYRNRIDAYVLVRYFSFLDRLMSNSGSYKSWCAIRRELPEREIERRVARVECRSKKAKVRLGFFLMKHRLYRMIWLLRKIQRSIMCVRSSA